ncbi:hypothetical protein EDC96DRAFT_578247 [Choanephora cucurbitarum]|nr:hypothetical protein EDC96DRAFT_578247 [Choanephora cucurbitarum]
METAKGLSEKRRQYEEEIALILDEEDQSLANWLNRVSFLLLKRSTDLNAIEIATLKLSLSGVANVCSEDYRDIMKAFLPTHLYEELVALKFGYCLPDSKARVIRTTVAELQEEAKKPRPDFKIEYGENETSLDNQVQLVFQYLFTSLQSMLKRKAEFSYVSLVDNILLHILNDTSIEVHPGETECFATKEAMLSNELSFSSSSNSRTGGRKIDLLVKKQGCELGVLEFERLDGIKLQLLQHCQFLKGRSLSVRSLSLVANSVILSRLWHLMRVVPLPSTWLTDITRIVRNFVMPFWPKPSWSAACRSKRMGGLGIADPLYQSLALQAVYVQKLLLTALTRRFPATRDCPLVSDSHWSGVSFAFIFSSEALQA